MPGDADLCLAEISGCRLFGRRCETTIDHMTGALRCAVLGFVLGSSPGLAQDSNPTIEVLEAETAEHRIGTRGPIYTDAFQNTDPADLARILQRLTLEVVVGTDGKTLDAKQFPDSSSAI